MVFLRQPQTDVNATGSIPGLSPNLRSKAETGAKDGIFPPYIAASKHEAAIVKELLKNVTIRKASPVCFHKRKRVRLKGKDFGVK